MAKKLVGAILTLGILGGLSGLIWILSNNKVVIGYNQGYEPEQPIPFSHELHAGQNKIDCKYCHVGTEKTRHASVPALNICMNCHIQVKTDSPWIKKLSEAYNSGTSIAWKRVHLLPDHVKFDHSAHIRRGKACQECHGPVETMPVVKQVSSLSMGWCVNCHRLPENKASTNCGTCHY